MVMTMAELPIRRGSCRDLGCFIAAVAARPRPARWFVLSGREASGQWARELCGAMVLKEGLVEAMAMERAEEEEVGWWARRPSVVGGSTACLT
jgi:hypothetical protein